MEQKIVEFKQIGKRLALIRKALGFETQKEFAEKLGISWRTIQNYEQAKFKKIPYGFFEKLEKQFGVSKEWIETGKGEMFKKEESDKAKYVNNIEKIEAGNVAHKMEAQTIHGTIGGVNLTPFEMALIEAFREKKEKISERVLLMKLLECLENIEE